MKRIFTITLIFIILGCTYKRKEPLESDINKFMEYIINGDKKNVGSMLKKYKNLDKYSVQLKSGRYNPLSVAAWTGNIEIVQLLLNEGANINALDDTGDFPLYLSIYGNEIRVIKLLIENGANVNLKTPKGVTALHHASNFGNLEIVKCLIDSGAEQSFANDGVDSVIEAVNGNNLDVLKYLLERGYNFEYKDQDGITPLLAAVLGRSDESLISFLIESGSDVNAVSNINFSIIYHDLYSNDGQYLKFLLEHGADPDIAPDHNFTLLHIVTTRRDIDKVKLLLKYNADASIKDIKDKTPLDYANELFEDEVSGEIVSLLEDAMK